MRIAIIGYSGAGKSTLANQLARHYHLDALHMDTTQFYGNMQTRSFSEQEKIVKDFLDSHDKWVIDGNYFKVAPERFEICDELYFLDYNRFYCLKESLKRYFKNRNKVRESLGCVERFDISFYIWILFGSRKKSYRKIFEEKLSLCKKVHHFKNRKALNEYLDNLF